MAEQIFFIGYMGAGKSTAARRLAEWSQRPALDLDEFIASRTGQSIASFIAQWGEVAFRSEESAALKEVVGCSDYPIVACGGGTTCNDENARRIAAAGHVVWLDPAFTALWDRLSASNDRPLLFNSGVRISPEELRRHHESRRRCYARHHERVGESVNEDHLRIWAGMLE